MAMSLKDFVAVHPVDRERVEAHKERMLAEVRTSGSVSYVNRPDLRSSPSVSASGRARPLSSSTAISTAPRSARFEAILKLSVEAWHSSM